METSLFILKKNDAKKLLEYFEITTYSVFLCFIFSLASGVEYSATELLFIF